MLLHVIANPRPRGQSRSLRLADAFLEGYRSANPGAEVQEVSLFDEDLPMIDARDVNLRLHLTGGADLTADEQKRFELFRRHIDPLIACDRLLITSPMWNFGPPWKLKQWLDTVVQRGLTFDRAPDGPKGLLTCERAAVVGSRGGVYEDGDPRETSDFLAPYLQRILGWMGVVDVRICFADRAGGGPEAKEQAMREAEDSARRLGEAF